MNIEFSKYVKYNDKLVIDFSKKNEKWCTTFFFFLTDDINKVGYLWEFDGAKDRLKIIKADLMVEGSFDQAIYGVDGVFHTASPVLVPYDNNIQAELLHRHHKYNNYKHRTLSK